MRSKRHVLLANEHHQQVISPGGVAPVGDTLMMNRFQRSHPDQPPLVVYNVAGGSNVVDGNNPAMYTVGAGARVLEDYMLPNSTDERDGVRIVQDLRIPDRLVEPLVASTQTSWQRAVATVYKQVHSDFRRPIAPFALQQGQLSRGPMPTSTRFAPPGGDPLPPHPYRPAPQWQNNLAILARVAQQSLVSKAPPLRRRSKPSRSAFAT